MGSSWLKKLALACLPAGLDIPLRKLLVQSHVTGDYSSLAAASAAAAVHGISFLSADYARLTARNWERARQEADQPLMSANEAGVMMACLRALAADLNGSESRVLDWGGGDGHFFWVWRNLVSSTAGKGRVDWTVLETRETVAALAGIAAAGLCFTDSESVIDSTAWRLVLMNNALHIFERPREILSRIFNSRAEFVLIGDVPVAFGARKDRLAIVRPPCMSRRRGYSFPFWILADDIWQLHEGAYAMIGRWPSGSTIVDGKRLERFSYFFKRV